MKQYESPLHNYKPAKKRKPRTTGLKMCSCYAFHCDPASMTNPFFLAKIAYRLANNLCGACGQQTCKCKS